jgi:hypothetical protein
MLYLTLPAPGQVAGQHRGLFLGFANLGSTYVSAVGQVDTAGRLTTFVSQPSGAWPHWGHVWGATHDADNEHVLVHALVGLVNPPTGYALVAWDPRAMAVTQTLWSGPFGQGTPQNLTNLSMNSNGHVVSYDSVLGHLVTFDPVTSAWQGIRVSGSNNLGLGGFVWDRLRGGYVYANSGSTTAAMQLLLGTTLDGTTTTLATLSNPSYRGSYGGDLLSSGDWVSGSLWNVPYLEVKAGSGQWTSGPLASVFYRDITAERWSAPGQGYWAATTSSPPQVVHVDAGTTPHTVTAVVSSSATPSQILEVLPLHDRDLATRRSGPATWDLLVQPGSAFAQETYVVAASLTAGNPPVVFPDGRELFLFPDALAVLSARGAVPPFLTGNVGTLDALGRATGSIRLGALGSKANGTVVHLAGVVLDAHAPSGVAWVLEPWALVVDVKQ